MKLLAASFLTLAWLSLCLSAKDAAVLEKPSAAAQNSLAATVKAAGAFIQTLDEAKKSKFLFKFTDEAQRKRWSNLPTGIYQRSGLKLGELNAAQRTAAMGLLAAALSREGYQKVIGIMEGDEIIRTRSGGGGLIFGRDEYFISILGTPSTSQPWLLQFGGHHLALNITYGEGHAILTPSHTAAQPASFQLEGKLVRPLGKETDIAFELINALDAAQQKQAVLGFQMRDLVLGPGQDAKIIQPEGLKASAMTESQKKLLVDLIHEWVGIGDDASTAIKMSEIKSHIADTWFAWSGPTAKGSAAYFRIQGPTVVIEFAPQRMGGDPTQHLHTIYRDPTFDYGRPRPKP